MRNRDRIRKIVSRAILTALLSAALFFCLFCFGARVGTLFWEQTEQSMIAFWCPALSFSRDLKPHGLWQSLLSRFPLLFFLGEEPQVELQTESMDTYEEIIRAEGRDESADPLSNAEMETPKTSTGRVRVDEDLERLLKEENGSLTGAALEEQADAGDSLPKQQELYQWAYFEKFDALVKEFYAVDPATAIDESQLNLDALLSPDLSIPKEDGDGPQILIYHTHSQEGFADSVPGDENTTIVGVGEVLARILREQYGYRVLHHTGRYDVENRDYAYNNSLPDLEALLAENPSIQVVIDLHRDEVSEDTRLVTTVDGRPTARFMFFNGLSRTRRHGDIEYLPNENIADNLAFSFQLQVLCNEYYPGLTRRIYLKGYRYNMHLKPRCLLIEMGAQNNTYEECYNACIPLARMLDMELSGTDFGYNG